jgi:hypothetical protein
MKNKKVSFLAVVAIVFGTSCANASECIGENCDMPTMAFEQSITPMNNVDFESVSTEEPLQSLASSAVIDWSQYDTCEYTPEKTCTYDYNCPFKTAEECAIWYKKPAFKTSLHPRAPHLNSVRIDDILYAIYSNYDVTANDEAMSPLLDRYLVLMRASKACCSEGIIYKMRENGADDAAVYKFLKDNANYFAVAQRCMVMNDDEFDSSYSNGVTGKMAIEVRNACLCKNRQWFETLLQPFFDVYARAPMFEDRPFPFSYRDDMQRDITVYINDEVHTTMGLINACPK